MRGLSEVLPEGFLALGEHLTQLISELLGQKSYMVHLIVASLW